MFMPYVHEIVAVVALAYGGSSRHAGPLKSRDEDTKQQKMWTVFLPPRNWKQRCRSQCSSCPWLLIVPEHAAPPRAGAWDPLRVPCSTNQPNSC